MEEKYTSKDFNSFCTKKEISRQFTSPYSPQQNGISERLNRIIIESARSMRHLASLPLYFWAEACCTAVYLHNRSPTAALENITPFECLYGKKPDVSHLGVFGCVCYIYVPNSQRQKLDAKVRKAILIGYPTGVKGYKLYDLEKKKLSLVAKFISLRGDLITLVKR